MTTIELFERAGSFRDAEALRCGSRTHTYSEILASSAAVASALLGETDDLGEARIAFFVPAGFEYVALQWGVWRAGGIAVPLNVSAAEPEIEHVLDDAEISVLVAPRSLRHRIDGLCQKLGIEVLEVEDALRIEPRPLPALSLDRRAMMLYTSGTTSKPKGVVTTHANNQAQVKSLVEAWGWLQDDCIPLFLPLHHVHGIINVLTCGLWSGAMVDVFDVFDVDRVLGRVADGAYTLFMAVPTIYIKLIRALEEAGPDRRRELIEGFAGMRLMISGSAALPASVHQHWTELTGQKLLERYGMTEIGMGISNPLHGERRPGAVGQPLPGVEVRLVSDSGDVVEVEDEPAEIQVRGPTVFQEYWRRPDVTEESFVDGWFKTGDVAILEDGYYRILGRQSVDIIKSGGYKLSALEIEDALRQHPAVRECAVVGVADDTWGEAVAVAAEIVEEADLGLDELRAWATDKLSKYKLPKVLRVVEELPRNAMGKVTKPAVKDLFDR
jgi:malonyl-CoA/methylmalonyl-CoA synthetase